EAAVFYFARSGISATFITVMLDGGVRSRRSATIYTSKRNGLHHIPRSTWGVHRIPTYRARCSSMVRTASAWPRPCKNVRNATLKFNLEQGHELGPSRR